jgi:Divergent InlB B-repeat domain
MHTSLRLVLLAVIASLVWPLASFAGPQLYTISVEINPAGAGAVTLDPAKVGYARNNVVTVSATPAPGKVFTGWGGALSGTHNPATLRVSGNHTVIANFATDAGGDDRGETDPPPPSGALPTKGMVVGYFAQWTIYRRGYLPKQVGYQWRGASVERHELRVRSAGRDPQVREPGHVCGLQQAL